MTSTMRTVGNATMMGLFLGAVGLAAGCGGGGAATPTERLWVSGIPTDSKAPMTAFVTMKSGEDGYLGAFFEGSLLRGSHDVFRWTPIGKARARVKFLQDGRSATLNLESCKPTRGFDHCLMVDGDPTGTERYQSRKRWVVRRPGRKRDAATGLVVQTLLELAQDDPELAAALDTAAEANLGPQ